jgi:hypothetical protein
MFADISRPAKHDSTTRVDSAHPVDTSGSLPKADAPDPDLLTAVAGQNARVSAKQLKGQTLELASFLQKKQELLDRRESELNARLAILESESRASRLRFDQSRSTDGSQDDDLLTDGRSPDYDSLAGASQERVSGGAVDPAAVDQAALAEKINHLSQREEQLQRLHDQIVELHREALELRIATEQTWAELSLSVSEQRLAATLKKHRTRLIDHYKLVSDELARRRDDLHRLRDQLAEHESDLRRQRLEVQLWVDRQRNEVEARRAETSLRESELARRQAEFQRDSVQWQKQREDYRREIDSLSRRLRQCSMP